MAQADALRRTIRSLSSVLWRPGLLVPWLLLGCATPDSTHVDTLIRDLNARQVSSCVFVQGNAAAYVTVRIITATGGAVLADCLDLR